MDPPTKINGVIYKLENRDPKVLVLKRNQKDGGFWQTLTGTVSDGEKPEDAVVREVLEETGIAEILDITGPICRFTWKRGGTPIREYVFAIKVSENAVVELSDEHTDHSWLSPNEAISTVRYDSNKKLLSLFVRYLNGEIRGDSNCQI